MKKGMRIFLTAAALLAGLVADSQLRLVTTEYELTYETLPAAFDGFRIVQLSDLHGAEFDQGNAALLDRVRTASPDLIALTGDLADSDTELAVIDRLLSGLTQLAPVYYVSGNHEWTDGMLEPLTVMLEEHGVRYLRNETVALLRGESRILLTGVEDPNGYRDQPKPPAVVSGYPEELFHVLLGHRNDFVEKYPELPVDLILCGHAHGGVIRIPGKGGLLGHGGDFFPAYTEGLFRSGRYYMLVSRGLGNNTGVPRLLNNPEVVAVTLRRKGEAGSAGRAENAQMH